MANAENNRLEKDIVLLLGSGGMTGIFTAGALEVVNRKFRDRIHSIYATSSGADVGAYFVSNQPHVPKKFFLEHLASKEFVRGNWLSYVWKIFFAPQSKSIPDFLNIDYVIATARLSDCAMDMKKFNTSDIGFHVKVIRLNDRKAVYLPAKENVFQKLKATSQCGPFTTSSVEIDGEQYIDGDIVISPLDEDLVRRMPEKKFIYIEPVGPETLSKILLCPFYLLAGFAIMRLYSPSLGARYISQLFQDRSIPIRRHSNVIYIRNQMTASIFSTDSKKLNAIYRHGLERTEHVLANM